MKLIISRSGCDHRKQLARSHLLARKIKGQFGVLTSGRNGKGDFLSLLGGKDKPFDALGWNGFFQIDLDAVLRKANAFGGRGLGLSLEALAGVEESFASSRLKPMRKLVALLLLLRTVSV